MRKAVAVSAMLAMTITWLAGPTSSGAIVQGENVVAYPWAVALVEKADGRSLAARFNCSGVLLTRSWVLTSAHCFDRFRMGGRLTKGDTVVIGRDQVGNSGQGETRSIADVKFMVDSSTYCGSRPFEQCDLALVRLSSPSTRIDVDLAGSEELSQWNVGTSGNVYGYGRPAANKPPTLDLKRAKIKITEFRTNHRTMFAKGVNGTQCSGDSGGPLLVSTSNGPRLVGIVRGLNGSCTVGGTESLIKVGWRGSTSNSPAFRWITSIA